ncbi:MAG: DUF4192 domain-containing protein [Candidatus Nanopelagicales bacterium]|nr:DUF4192 domain-containing protein [Candidatus Nanopelagicales bacterium]
MTIGFQPTPAHILRSPDHLLAALPFLIGFHPRHSLVLVWLQGASVALTQRVDLPGELQGAEPARAHARWIAEVLRPRRHLDADALVGIVYAAPTPRADDRAQLLGELARQAAGAGLEVLDLLMVRDDEWRRCAPDGHAAPGRPCVLDPRIAAEVREDFVSAGWSHAGSRDDLARDLRPDARARAAVMAVMPSSAPAPAEREAWRDAMLASLVPALDHPAVPGPVGLAEVIDGLGDIRVRDCVLWHLVHREDLTAPQRLMTAAMIAAPDGQRAPVATVAAITAWLLGDGVRASLCIDIAMADDHDYGLAMLVGGALAHGLPPRMWRETLDQLTLEACRYGADA